MVDMNSRGLALWAALLVVGSVTGFVTSGYAYAGVPSLQPRISELTEGLRETESELVASETRLSSLKSDLGKAISQTSSLEQSLATAKSELTNTQADLSKANAQVESLESASKSREAEVIRLEDELRTIQRPFEPFRKAVNSSQNATVKLASVILNLRSANSQARVGAYDESVKFLRTALTLHEEYLGISADKLAGLQQASNLATG
ncbi:MAG: hypothetical protein HY619_00545, partial [Thaumarchaeota archaeon]|nr:hypothetical protein [Nitrososphaerota archaeon]